MVKKWVLLLILFPLIVFFSSCPTPTESTPPSVVGAWENAGYTADTFTGIDFTFTINSDASYVLTYEAGGGSNIQTGTLSPATLPANTTITGTVVTSDGPMVPPAAQTWIFRYSNLKASEFNFECDPALDGWNGPFAMLRQTTSIVGTWSCASTAPYPLTDIVMTIDADCSFAVSYEYGGSNTQTGTFYPYTMNADTDLAAIVATSVGPNAPPPPTPVTITVASPAVITWTGHGKIASAPVLFTTTGDLPTGLLPGTIYYVVGSITADTFQVSSTPGGAAINTSGTQSGTHMGWSVWLMKYTNLAATTVDVSLDTTGTGAAYIGPFTFNK